MTIERLHSDHGTNKRNRVLAKGSLEYRVEVLERIIISMANGTKMGACECEHLALLEAAETSHPVRDD